MYSGLWSRLRRHACSNSTKLSALDLRRHFVHFGTVTDRLRRSPGQLLLQKVIDYLREENRVLRDLVPVKHLPQTDVHRQRHLGHSHALAPAARGAEVRRSRQEAPGGRSLQARGPAALRLAPRERPCGMGLQPPSRRHRYTRPRHRLPHRAVHPRDRRQDPSAKRRRPLPWSTFQ